MWKTLTDNFGHMARCAVFLDQSSSVATKGSVVDLFRIPCSIRNKQVVVPHCTWTSAQIHVTQVEERLVLLTLPNII